MKYTPAIMADIVHKNADQLRTVAGIVADGDRLEEVASLLATISETVDLIGVWILARDRDEGARGNWLHRRLAAGVEN